MKTDQKKLFDAKDLDLLNFDPVTGVFNLYPGCEATQDPIIDGTSMLSINHLTYTLWKNDNKYACDLCKGNNIEIKDSVELSFKDCTQGAFKVVLKIKVPEVICSDCKSTKWLVPTFIHKNQIMTKRLYAQIVQLLVLGHNDKDIKMISALTGVDADIIQDIIKQEL